MSRNNSSANGRFGEDPDFPLVIFLLYWLTFEQVDFGDDSDDGRDHSRDRRGNCRSKDRGNGRDKHRNNGRDDDPDMDDIREAIIRILRRRVKHML